MRRLPERTPRENPPLSAYYAKILELTTNEPIELAGFTFENLADFLNSHEAEMNQLIDTYATVGDYAEAAGISSFSDITNEQLTAALELADKVINQGYLETVTNDSLSLLAVADAEGCGKNAAGLGFGVGGLALGCLGAPIIGCLLGAGGVIGPSMDMSKSCETTKPGDDFIAPEDKFAQNGYFSGKSGGSMDQQFPNAQRE